MRPSIALAALSLSTVLAGCGDGYAVVVRFEGGASPSEAQSVEIDLTHSCASGERPWQSSPSAVASLRFRPGDEVEPRLGQARPGRYALRARVRDESCAVYAAGCVEVEVEPWGAGTLEVVVAPVSDPGCGEGEGCQDGLCVDLDGLCPATPGWTRTLGGMATGPSVAVARDGSMVVMGFAAEPVDLDPGPGVVEHDPSRALTVFLVVLDADGRYRWSGVIEGSLFFNGWHVAMTDGGEVVVAGSFGGTVDLDPGPGVDERTSEGLSDAFVVRLGAGGEVRWIRTLGGTGHVWAFGVDVAGEDLVAVAGLFSGAADLHPDPEIDPYVSPGDQSSFVTLLDGEGRTQWARAFLGDDTGQARRVAMTFDESEDNLRAVTVIGEFSGGVDLDPGSAVAERHKEGDLSGYVVSLDGAGDYRWDALLGGTEAADHVITADLAVTPGDELVVAGYYRGGIALDPEDPEEREASRYGSTDIFLYRFAYGGQLRRSVETGGPGEDFALDVAVAPDGELLLVGSFGETFDFDPGEAEDVRRSTGIADGYILRLDLYGEYLWGRRISSNLVDAASSVAVFDDGGLAVAGFVSNSEDFDPGPCVDEGAGPVFVSRLLEDGSYEH